MESTITLYRLVASNSVGLSKNFNVWFESVGLNTPYLSQFSHHLYNYHIYQVPMNQIRPDYATTIWIRLT